MYVNMILYMLSVVIDYKKVPGGRAIDTACHIYIRTLYMYVKITYYW